jgi:hypothetical protein
VVSSSITLLVKKGYTHQQARTIVCDVIEAVGRSDGHFETWALEWLRRVWLAAKGPPGPPAGGFTTPAEGTQPEGTRS